MRPSAPPLLIFPLGLLAAAALWLASSGAARSTEPPQFWVRLAIPSIEAYNADHAHGYRGMTVTKLRRHYDARIRHLRVVRASATSYCLESVVGSAAASKTGPAGTIVDSRCR